MSPLDTWHSSAITNILAWVSSTVLWGVCLCYTMANKLTKVYTNDTCSRTPSSYTLNYKPHVIYISMLKIIFPLHTKTQKYHLKVSQSATLHVKMWNWWFGPLTTLWFPVHLGVVCPFILSLGQISQETHQQTTKLKRKDHHFNLGKDQEDAL